MATRAEGNRCRRDRDGLGRRHHGARADAGGTECGGPRARARSPSGGGFRHAGHPRRTQIPAAAGIDGRQFHRHHHLPQPVRRRWRFPSGAGARFCPAKAWAAPAITGAARIGAFTPTISACAPICRQRYGAKTIPDTMTIQDWPVSYDELEPYLRPLRQGVRRLRQGGKSQGPQDRGRQCFRRPARQRLSQQADAAFRRRRDVRRGRQKPGLPSLPGAVLGGQRALQEYLWRRHGRLPGMRLLHPHRLRSQRQGLVRHHHHAGVAPGAEIRTAHPRLRLQAALRQGRQARHRRALYRPQDRAGI